MPGGARWVVDARCYVDWYLDGRPKLDDLLVERIGLSDMNRGFNYIRSGGIARSLFIMDS